MNQNDLRSLEADFSGACSAITCWDRVIANGYESATKRVYVQAIGWDWVQELRCKRAARIRERFALAKLLAAHGMKIRKMPEYAARAENPMTDPE